MSAARKRSRQVREPIQVYLTPDERALLDRAAELAGVSRAEVLRRGMRTFAAELDGAASPMLAFIDSIKGVRLPRDIGERHDVHLEAAYLDPHEPPRR